MDPVLNDAQLLTPTTPTTPKLAAEFEALLSSAINGGTVVLTKNFTVDKQVDLNKQVTIKSDGQAIRTITIDVKDAPAFLLDSTLGVKFENVILELNYCDYQVFTSPLAPDGTPTASGLTFDKVIFRQNSGSCNFFSVSDLIIQNSTFYGLDSGSAKQSSILSLSGQNITIHGSTFVDVYSNYSSAVSAAGVSGGSFIGNLFTATPSGGGIVNFISSSSINLNANTCIKTQQASVSAPCFYSIGASQQLTDSPLGVAGVANTFNTSSISNSSQAFTLNGGSASSAQLINVFSSLPTILSMSCSTSTNLILLTSNPNSLPLNSIQNPQSPANFLFFPGAVAPGCD